LDSSSGNKFAPGAEFLAGFFDRARIAEKSRRPEDRKALILNDLLRFIGLQFPSMVALPENGSALPPYPPFAR
jgi:hypothetical protein